MNWRERSIALVLTSLLLFAQAVNAADTEPGSDERNYRVIIDRNPFGLKPPPPPPTNIVPVVKPPKEEVFLTGITSFGVLRAHFMTMGTKSPKGAKEPEYYSLGVDEKKDALEIIDIDALAGSVRVRDDGVETVMTFESNGVKPPATPAGPVPGAPGIARAGMPPIPGAVPPPGAGVRLSPGATAVTAGATTPRRTGRVRTIPSRNVRTPVQQPIPDQDVEPNPNAAVEDVLIMEVQRRANPDITFPPIPMPQ